MSKILMPIKKEYADKILDGTKKYEYRLSIAQRPVSCIVIHVPETQRVVAEAEVLEVLALSPKELWNLTKDGSGITKQFFDEYFSGKETAYAYKLGKVTKVDKKASDYTNKHVQPNFVYID